LSAPSLWQSSLAPPANVLGPWEHFSFFFSFYPSQVLLRFSHGTSSDYQDPELSTALFVVWMLIQLTSSIDLEFANHKIAWSYHARLWRVANRQLERSMGGRASPSRTDRRFSTLERSEKWKKAEADDAAHFCGTRPKKISKKTKKKN